MTSGRTGLVSYGGDSQSDSEEERTSVTTSPPFPDIQVTVEDPQCAVLLPPEVVTKCSRNLLRRRVFQEWI